MPEQDRSKIQTEEFEYTMRLLKNNNGPGLMTEAMWLILEDAYYSKNIDSNWKLWNEYLNGLYQMKLGKAEEIMEDLVEKYKELREQTQDERVARLDMERERIRNILLTLFPHEAGGFSAYTSAYSLVLKELGIDLFELIG
jgi:hypothetical protein